MEKHSPIFSIVIPVYKVEAYLRQCLDSVISQSFADWECICVDDGSPDACPEMLDQYSANDARIKVIHQSNRGVSVARNAALDVATGAWVLFLDGDDWFGQGFLYRIAEALKSCPDIDALAYGFCRVSPDGSMLANQPSIPEDALIDGSTILAECPTGNWKYSHCCWDKAYRRSVLEEFHIRFDSMIRLGEDTLFANEFLSVCGGVKVVGGEVGYQCVNRDGSALHSVRAEMLNDDLLRFDRTLRWWQMHRSNGLFKTLIFWAMALPALGKNRGVREACIEMLLDSSIYKKEAIPFLMWHGTAKARLFALIYRVSPRGIRRTLLRMI